MLEAYAELLRLESAIAEHRRELQELEREERQRKLARTKRRCASESCSLRRCSGQRRCSETMRLRRCKLPPLMSASLCMCVSVASCLGVSLEAGLHLLQRSRSQGAGKRRGDDFQ